MKRRADKLRARVSGTGRPPSGGRPSYGRRPSPGAATGGRRRLSGRPAGFARLIGKAVEAAANGIVITDRDGIVLWVNPAFTEITGYAGEEVLGRTPSILKSGRQPASFYKDMWRTITAGNVWHGELYNRHRDGHVYIEEQTIAPVADPTGRITHFIGIKQDVTRRKEHERTLERRNAELAVMATAVGSITSSLDVDSVMRFIVDAIRDLLPNVLGATIQVPDGTEHLVTRVATSCLARRAEPLWFAPGKGAAGIAWAKRRIVNIADVQTDPRFEPGREPAGYRSLIALPINSRGEVHGVLSVESTEQAAFQQHEEDLLTLFAGSAAIAMRHAAEYAGRAQAERELKRYSEQLEQMVEQRTADLRAAQAKLLEQQRLEQEVVLAAEVQASILPRRTPELPGYDFAGVALAARYLSGDLYDWLSTSPDHCYLALADVAGKGVAAAMMTSTARALLRDGAARKTPPGQGLSSLNRSLYDDLTQADMFITVVTATLDRRTAAVDYASAGHTEVLWYRAARRSCERLGATGPPIGVLRDNPVEQRRIVLLPGDLLVFYSDGVTEAEDGRGRLFGTGRLVEVLESNRALPAAALARSIVEAVDAFSSGSRSDDLTLIVVKALPRTLPFRLPGDLGHLEEAMALLQDLARAYGPGFAYELELAASEIVTNVMEHAYRDRGGELRGQIHLEPDRVEIDIYDDGLPFDLAALPEQDPRQARERGYGVYIARQLVDEISYTPATPDGNHWRLVKSTRREEPKDAR
ncbi:MAG TPA: SpoIIE family protein phosphatase [Anaeromyxobacter sp.]|nr:SpoIIE family protein phosphatase [Anaeromyxobacter sp.]